MRETPPGAAPLELRDGQSTSPGRARRLFVGFVHTAEGRDMRIEDFHRAVEALHALGHADADIAWAEGVTAPEDPEAFAREAIFVICNSGMRHTVARGIYERVMAALLVGRSASSGFGHLGKAAAIDRIWLERGGLHEGYLAAGDKVAYLGALPWIGGITKWHLAKNFGADVAKPDVHLVRLADHHGTTPQELCERLSRESGYRVGTVDTLLWRACAVGVIDSRALSGAR